jgi:CxxC-x17-CxxC domain-containing protein
MTVMKKAKTGPKVDPYLEGLMAKLLERLVSLEKKMDTLMSKVGNLSSAANVQPKSQIQHAPPPRQERTLYEAICADCHKVCEVPFRPTETRPVYCKECWAKRKAGGKGPAFPVLTPVALAPKPLSKLGVPPPAPSAKPVKKAKKTAPSKKAKKKK